MADCLYRLLYCVFLYRGIQLTTYYFTVATALLRIPLLVARRTRSIQGEEYDLDGFSAKLAAGSHQPTAESSLASAGDSNSGPSNDNHMADLVMTYGNTEMSPPGYSEAFPAPFQQLPSRRMPRHLPPLRHDAVRPQRLPRPSPYPVGSTQQHTAAPASVTPSPPRALKLSNASSRARVFDSNYFDSPHILVEEVDMQGRMFTRSYQDFQPFKIRWGPGGKRFVTTL